MHFKSWDLSVSNTSLISHCLFYPRIHLISNRILFFPFFCYLLKLYHVFMVFFSSNSWTSLVKTIYKTSFLQLHKVTLIKSAGASNYLQYIFDFSLFAWIFSNLSTKQLDHFSPLLLLYFITLWSTSWFMDLTCQTNLITWLLAFLK